MNISEVWLGGAYISIISIKLSRCAFSVLLSLSPGCVVPPYPGLLIYNPFRVLELTRRLFSHSPTLPFSPSPLLPFSFSPFLPFSSSPFLPFSSSPFLPFSISPFLPFSLSPLLPFSSSPFLPFSLSPLLPFSLSPLLPLLDHERITSGLQVHDIYTTHLRSYFNRFIL